ncbi:hypothetical protein EL22_25240 [Halostagnicola sp. A56]|nr:hypothetical protein EL22_25240 [Halostagnicola sp. A56]
MFGRLWSLFELAGVCLLLPAIVLHELTHWIAARGVADDLRFHANSMQPAVSVNWSEGVPRWRLRAAKIAPTITGLALGPLVAIWLFRGGEHGLVTIVLVSTLWVVYTKPSQGDLQEPRMA